ncbi:sugar transferase [Levilactobacillus brevis]|uniref:sugar transferase n=1 Tax=Levilactobacillus brevis TaxID=1580 RepID=UPI003DA7844F
MVTVDSQRVQSKWIYHIIKRLFDIIVSLTALVILSPVFLLIALVIKCDDSKGSAFYSQIRIGKDDQKFKMYKFRSMVSDADSRIDELLKYNEVDGAMFKMKEDPRITRVGKFLRRHSLDELPQLVNVLKGDMSLVGPRPPLPREVEQYSPIDTQRLLVTPGCTGLWQVSGRNDVDFHTMVELDLKYINKANLWMDFTILIRTIEIIIKPNNAY